MPLGSFVFGPYFQGISRARGSLAPLFRHAGHLRASAVLAPRTALSAKNPLTLRLRAGRTPPRSGPEIPECGSGVALRRWCRSRSRLGEVVAAVVLDGSGDDAAEVGGGFGFACVGVGDVQIADDADRRFHGPGEEAVGLALKQDGIATELLAVHGMPTTADAYGPIVDTSRDEGDFEVVDGLRLDDAADGGGVELHVEESRAVSPCWSASASPR